jgi:hypothetical protein
MKIWWRLAYYVLCGVTDLIGLGVDSTTNNEVVQNLANQYLRRKADRARASEGRCNFVRRQKLPFPLWNVHVIRDLLTTRGLAKPVRPSNINSSSEGFYEDLVRQNTVARRFQRQLGFGVVTYGFSVIVVAS